MASAQQSSLKRTREQSKLPTAAAAFVRWAKQSLVPLASPESGRGEDLAALGALIGDATVVALSEPIHGGAEPLEFRNRVMRYLAEEKGFTAIAIESGIVEGRLVHDYVRGAGASEELPDVLARGLSWTFEHLPQNASLVRWLRQYNADPRHFRKLNFYGFDVPGSPANPHATRGLETAVAEVIEYLASVDSAAAAQFRGRLDALMTCLSFDLRGSVDGDGYERLGQVERDTLTAAIADLVTLLDRREAKYTSASSAVDYAWARRAAAGACQADAWLRQIPIDWQPVREAVEFPNERVSFLSVAADVRDRAQADNLEWILQQEGPNGKLLVFGHRYHLSASPIRANYWLPNDEEREHEVAGTYLRRRLNRRMVAIGSLLGRGEVRCADFSRMLERAPIASMDGIAGAVGSPGFLLDLRPAPRAVADWLNHEHWLAHGRQVFKLAIGRAFDVLYYLDAITPAHGADQLTVDRGT